MMRLFSLLFTILLVTCHAAAKLSAGDDFQETDYVRAKAEVNNDSRGNGAACCESNATHTLITLPHS